MESGLRRGQLTKWKDDRGFGFIQPIDGSQEVFLHISELKDATRRPQVKDTIYYHSTVDSDGRVRACNAFILGARSKLNSSGSTGNAVSLLDFPVLKLVLLLILPLVGSVDFAWTRHNPVPLILYPAMSLLTYRLYADDKSRAKKKVWRIPEKTLHLYELLGGWVGGFVAQRVLYHKSSKQSYQVVFWTIVIMHQIAWLYWLALGKQNLLL